MNFKKKSVLIIGGLGGLGKAISRELIKNGLTRLGVIDILNESEPSVDITSWEGSEKHASLSSILYIYKECSVTNYSLLKRTIKSIKELLKNLDVIINAAGIANELNPQKVIDINFVGTVNSTLIGIGFLRRDLNDSSEGGIIINIASIAGLRPIFFMPIYSGTKHAIIGFTRSLTNQAFYDRTHIKFIVICPGATRTQIIGHENVIDKFLFPEMLNQVEKISKNMNLQDPDIVAKCVIMALNDNQNGSIWQCENSHIEKLQMHEYPEF